jgi:predicted N-acetyltransferase YhbS
LPNSAARKWQYLYEDWNEAVAMREFKSQRADGTLPLSLVAVEKGELLGMVSLVYDDLPGYSHLNPWLASLLVLPEHRGKGTGSCLVREVERLLAHNSVPVAYLFSESASPFFEKLGWDAIEQATCNQHRVVILKKTFPENRT